MGPLGAFLGPSWGHLGPILGQLGPLLAIFGHVMAMFGICSFDPELCGRYPRSASPFTPGLAECAKRLNPAAAFRLARCVSLPEASSCRMLLAELKMASRIPWPVFSPGPFWPQDGSSSAQVRPSSLQVASSLPSSSACCRQVASRCLQDGFKSAKKPSWSHLGHLREAKKHCFSLGFCRFSAISPFRRKIA